MKKNVLFRSDPARLSLILFLLGTFSASCGYTPEVSWEVAETTHNVVTGTGLQFLWSRPDVYSEVSWGFLHLASSDSNVFILGSLTIDDSNRINALDTGSGEPVWKSDPMPPSTLFANRDGLFVGESGGGGRITSFNTNTGEIQWSRTHWESSGVENLLIYKNQLHAFLAPDIYEVLNPMDGKKVSSVQPEPPPFYNSTLCGEIFQAPLYTLDTIYYRTGKGLASGNICAVDISTGELRWVGKVDVISNIVVTNKAVFFLVESGNLLALDPATGEEISTLCATFNNTPFTLYGSHTEVGNYLVAYNAEEDILFTYLGDSHQLLAFRMK